jgi:hypothetical protein
MNILWQWLERYGRPLSVYTDCNSMSHRARPRVDGAEMKQPAFTQIGRACRVADRGQQGLLAASEGRVERSFQTAQDRLVKGLWVAGRADRADRPTSTSSGSFCRGEKPTVRCSRPIRAMRTGGWIASTIWRRCSAGSSSARWRTTTRSASTTCCTGSSRPMSWPDCVVGAFAWSGGSPARSLRPSRAPTSASRFAANRIKHAGPQHRQPRRGDRIVAAPG